MKKENRGGDGRNQGRKAHSEKSEVVRLYIKPSKIEKYGGIKLLRSDLYNFIEKKLQNK